MESGQGDSLRQPLELPPRPDRNTGEPFPPHAPAIAVKEKSDPSKDPTLEKRLSFKPKPPDGMGPVLAWRRKTVNDNIARFAISLAVLVVGTTLISLMKELGPFFLFGVWQIWLILFAGAYLMSSPFRLRVLAAGADWFQIHSILPFRKNRYGLVKLYELTEVEASFGPTEYHLFIADKDTTVELLLMEWQDNPRLWDLVYNGILHSVSKGANINTTAVAALRIDQTPALDIARRAANASRRTTD